MIGLLLLGLFWLLKNSNKQEIEETLDQIPDIEQRLLVKNLLTDEGAITYLERLLEAA